MIQRCWLACSVALLSLLFDILSRRSNLHRQQSQFHDQGNRRATQNAHAEFCWLRHKVFPSHPAGAFADLLADVAWLKV